MQLSALPRTYADAFRHTHISNVKEVDKSKSNESVVQDVGDDAQSAMVPEVQEKWVDDRSRDLFVSLY